MDPQQRNPLPSPAEGTLTVWEDMTMQRRPIAGKGFQTQPPADKQAARAKRT